MTYLDQPDARVTLSARYRAAAALACTLLTACAAPEPGGLTPSGDVGVSATALTSESCSAQMTSDCAFFTCGCLNNECSGDGCPSLVDGCSADVRSACAADGCGCANEQCSGGACPSLRPSQDLPTATQFDVAAERAALLAGVTSPVRIGAGAYPGGIGMFDAQSFPVLLSDQLPVVAASRSHSGRAVAFGHPDFFDRTVLTSALNASTARLVENAARWAAAGKPSPQIGVIAGSNDGLATLLGRTMTVRTLGSPITASSLAGLDVVTLIAYQPRSESEIQALETFNINGGGLLVAGLGWSWMTSPMTELREMPGNRVLARTYLGFTEPSRAPAAIPVQASPPSISNAVHAYNHLRAAAPPTTAAGIADIRRIQAYVRDVIPLLTLPSQLKAALQQLMHATKNAYPSAAAPLDPVDRPFDTLGLMYAARRPFDPARVAAHPAASDFPGAVAASAPRVQKYVSIDTRVPGWHSTELYAAPGETLGLLVAAHATAGGLRLRIGAHTDQLWDKGQKPPTPSHADDRWLRMPEISRSFPLDRALLQAGSDFGGLVYVMVPEGSSLGTVTVLITNAVEAPLYRLGVTNAQSWADIRNRPAPWGELAADNIVLTLESRLLRGVNDPAAITSRWRDVTVAQDELAQWPAGRRKRADRVVFDRQISIGFMHAGYPVMSPTGDFSPRPETPDYIEREVLAESSFTNPATEAMWGMFHELGHEHQHAAWTFDGTVEVTNNLFTMYTIESVTGFPKETGISNVSAAGQKTEMCRYFHPTVAFDPFPLPPGVVQGTTFAYWKHRPFLALAMYIQLMDRLAATRGGDPWAPYKRVFKDYIDRPISDYSDDAKRDQWLIRLSRAANANLGPYFQTWKIPTTLTARNAVSSLPAFSWQPPAQSSCP